MKLNVLFIAMREHLGNNEPLKNKDIEIMPTALSDVTHDISTLSNKEGRILPIELVEAYKNTDCKRGAELAKLQLFGSQKK